MSARAGGWLTSLSAKYIALFALLVAVPVIGTSVYLLGSSYRDNERALIRVQQAKAQSLASAIEQSLSEAADRLSTIHGADLSRHELELVLRPLLVSEYTPFEVFYMDSHSRTTYSVRAGGGGISPGLPSRAFESARNGVQISEIHLGLQLPWIAIATPENYGGGVVGEKLYVTPIQVLIAHSRLGRSGYAYAVDPRGRPISHPNDFVLNSFKKLSLPQVTRALDSSSATGSATGRNFRGQKVLSAWATVTTTGWRVFVEEPESAAFAPLRGKIWRTALLLAAFVGAAILLSILLARRLVRPIKRMQVAAARIGAGAYDERIDLERRDELGGLADELNRMGASLQGLIEGLERKVAERTAALEVASKHKSEFLANMSHELRTPLNAIVGFSQVLRQKLFGEVNEKQEEYLDDILSSGDHLLSLINDILDISKVEAGQVELELALFSLREALERGVVMVREKAIRDGIQVELRLDPSVDLVEGDERRIRQVVFNLLSNAVKFTPEGGRVEVSAAREDGQVKVAVADTGVGIAEDDRERIFEEFQQARTENGQRPEGTGLGLALSRKLVELHGGRIWVESEPGEGSTFTFTIPVESS